MLKRYANDLSNEAQGELQKNAALLVHALTNDITSTIRNRFGLGNIQITKRTELLKMHDFESADQVMLNRFLNDIAPRDKGKREKESKDTRNLSVLKDGPVARCSSKDTASDPDLNCDQSSYNFNLRDNLSNSFLFVIQVKQFMVQSNAFNNFRQQLNHFVHSIIHDTDSSQVIKFTP